jgi:hypothetical protein
MKRLIYIAIAMQLFHSCGIRKEAFTNTIKDKFDLTTKEKMSKVQFYLSATVQLTKLKQDGNQTTGTDGSLITNSSKQEEVITIPINTKCVFDSFGPNGEINIRFEHGPGKTLTFAIRPNQTTNTKYYIVADWNQENGNKILYGGEQYLLSPAGGSALLNVKLKNLNKTYRKEKVIRGGLKV